MLQESAFGKKIIDEQLSLPQEKCLPGTNTKMPYFFVADSAFPLRKNIMRPYPGSFLSYDKLIFNYRLSRARRMIENAFGILVSRWRILKTSLNFHPKNVDKIVLATVALHNFIMKSKSSQYCNNTFVDWEDKDGTVHDGEWRNEANNNLTKCRLGSNNASRVTFANRNILKDYFLDEGEIPFQYKVLNNE